MFAGWVLFSATYYMHMYISVEGAFNMHSDMLNASRAGIHLKQYTSVMIKCDGGRCGG